MARWSTWDGMWVLLAGAGLLLVAASLALPWRDEDLRVGVGTRLVVAAGGALLVALARRSPPGTVRSLTTMTGFSVLAYPVVLAVSAGRGGWVLGAAWHVLPLTLVQVVPLLATVRPRRRWVAGIVGVALVGGVLTGAGRLLTVSLVLWFGSFALAPLVCWLGVRGTSGTTRRRAVLAALSALAAPLVIAFCVTTGVLAAAVGLTDDAVTALLLGFAGGTTLCGVLALGAVGPERAWVLDPRVVTALLDALLATAFLIAVGLTVVLVADSDIGAGTGVLVGIGATAVLGLPWLRLRRWTARVVDPAAELAHELARAGSADGRQRQVAVHVLRTLVGDPDLELRYDEPAGPEDVVLAREEATVLVVARSRSAGDRLAHLGDCTSLLRPALLEDRVARESRRADRSAAAERERISHDLHDGLQGRLLGLALNLQLSGRTLEDPAARLLVESTVGSLREVVEDVRALGGGRIPELLATGGLPAALPVLFQPVSSVVDLDLPPTRFTPTSEATAYFLIAEAVSNALKHAAAERISVSVTGAGDRLSVIVADDGRGGADPRLGSGLRALSERVGAVGGVLVVRDGSSSGTVVEAVLPCGS